VLLVTRSNWSADERKPSGWAEKSALEHLLDGRRRFPGWILLPETWRLHRGLPIYFGIFYDDKLRSHAISRSRVLEGTNG